MHEVRNDPETGHLLLGFMLATYKKLSAGRHETKIFFEAVNEPSKTWLRATIR